MNEKYCVVDIVNKHGGIANKQSDDDDSDWIAVRMNKETMTASQKIMMKYGQRFRDVEVHDFTERTGPVF